MDISFIKIPKKQQNPNDVKNTIYKQIFNNEQLKKSTLNVVGQSTMTGRIMIDEAVNTMRSHNNLRGNSVNSRAV